MTIRNRLCPCGRTSGPCLECELQIEEDIQSHRLQKEADDKEWARIWTLDHPRQPEPSDSGKDITY